MYETLIPSSRILNLELEIQSNLYKWDSAYYCILLTIISDLDNLQFNKGWPFNKVSTV